MKRTFGALTLEVPSGFDEDPLIILRGPAPAASLRMQAGEPMRPTYVLRRTALRAEPQLPLEALAEGEERMVLQSIPGAIVTARTTETIGGHTVAVRELSFDGPQGVLRQRMLSLITGGSFVTAVVTAPDDLEFEGVKTALGAIVASVSVEP